MHTNLLDENLDKVEDNVTENVTGKAQKRHRKGTENFIETIPKFLVAKNFAIAQMLQFAETKLIFFQILLIWGACFTSFAMTMSALVRHGHCEPPFGGEATTQAYWYLKPTDHAELR
jgi:hypothetical protein